MFKQCAKCKEIKIWFRFYSSNEGLYVWTPNYCKKCASVLTWKAVREDLEKIEATKHRLPKTTDNK